MNRIDFSSTVTRFDFKKVGEISNDLHFNLDFGHLKEQSGFVYLWVEVSGDMFTIVYVGKAGGTLRDRFNQHKSGFRHSAPGQSHAKRLHEGIAETKCYEVYARESVTKEILGEKGISMACVEEQAFIQKFQPLWNGTALKKGEQK